MGISGQLSKSLRMFTLGLFFRWSPSQEQLGGFATNYANFREWEKGNSRQFVKFAAGFCICSHQGDYPFSECLSNFRNPGDTKEKQRADRILEDPTPANQIPGRQQPRVFQLVAPAHVIQAGKNERRHQPETSVPVQ